MKCKLCITEQMTLSHNLFRNLAKFHTNKLVTCVNVNIHAQAKALFIAKRRHFETLLHAISGHSIVGIVFQKSRILNAEIEMMYELELRFVLKAKGEIWYSVAPQNR